MLSNRQGNIPIYSSGAFSAAVRVELLIAGKRIPVAQVGEDRLIFDKPMAFADLSGEVVMYIDETPQRWRVKLLPGPTPTRIVSAEFDKLL